jgi:hypothetical protein
MAPKMNMPSILDKGILCHNKAQGIEHIDFSLYGVQKRRLPYHDYVPLYFNTHTPMQYVLTHDVKGRKAVIEQSDLVFILFKAQTIFSIPNVQFTDGNAADRESTLYKEMTDLGKLDWPVILEKNRCYNSELKRKKAAEVLVPSRIPPEYFQKIACYDGDAIDYIKENVEKNNIQTLQRHNIPIIIDSVLYYND